MDTTILSLTSAKVDDRCCGQATLPIYYKCEACNYTSILKANYDRHMMTRKHLKNMGNGSDKVEKFEKVENGGEETENGGGVFNTPQVLDNNPTQNIDIPIANENITISLKDDDIFYATKIYNTLFEFKRQYPDKYQFVRNTERMKREWKRWSQEQFDNDYVFCYTKWFGLLKSVNHELIGRFVF